MFIHTGTIPVLITSVSGQVTEECAGCYEKRNIAIIFYERETTEYFHVVV
jgi:hypothetical protein